MFSTKLKEIKLPEIITSNNKIVKSSSQMNINNSNSTTLDLTKDDYSSTLFEIKQKRKIIENNRYILANRLRILQQEETKLLKNVEGIQKKTVDVLKLKANKEYLMKSSASMENIQTTVYEEEELLKRKRIEELDRYETKARINDKINSIQNSKHNERKLLKDKIKNDLIKRQDDLNLQYKKRLEKTSKVKLDEEIAIKRKNNYLKHKLEHIKDIKTNELENELSEIQNYEKQITLLSQNEDIILDNINHITNQQYEVFDKLNQAKDLSNQEAYLEYHKLNSTKYGKTKSSFRSSYITDNSTISLTKKNKEKIYSPLKPISTKQVLEPLNHTSLYSNQSIIDIKKPYLNIDDIKQIYSPLNKKLYKEKSQ